MVNSKLLSYTKQQEILLDLEYQAKKLVVVCDEFNTYRGEEDEAHHRRIIKAQELRDEVIRLIREFKNEVY